MANIIRIGTYNVNNLFDRFDDPYSFGDDPWRSNGYGTSPKKLSELYNLGGRIRSSNVHVLALQEIESYGTLRDFVQGHVGPEYKVQDGIVSIPSNDPRGIDLALLSKYPIGRVISHRYLKQKNRLAFSRDCLEIEILNKKRTDRLLTVFICHLKSKYSRYKRGTDEYEEDQVKSNRRRAAQVEATIEIVKSSQDIEKDRFVILGDMNDTPDSSALSKFLAPDNELNLVNALAAIEQEDEAPESSKKRKRDTHKWTRVNSEGKKVTTYSQLDYILLSSALAKQFTQHAKVEQSRYTTGSDHYLSWAEIDLDL